MSTDPVIPVERSAGLSPIPRAIDHIVVPIVRGLWRTFEMCLFLSALVLVWWAAVVVFRINPIIIPSPVGVWQSGVEHADLLLFHTMVTIGEALAGFAIAIVIGVLLAIVIESSEAVSRFLLPFLVGVNATPKVVVAPILVIWLGFGVASKIGMAFLLCFFPIVISCIQGLSNVEPDLIDLYRLMQASNWNIMRKVRIPNAVPYLLSGFKVALPTAMIGALIGEFVVARQGIGQQIMMAYSSFNIELVFAGVILITVASVLLFQLLVWVETLVLAIRPFNAEARTG